MAETAVAVRELVAFCHRSGDIDQRFQASPTAADGQRGHREVAGRRLPTVWRLEVPGRGVDVTVRAVNPDQWMDTSFAYWEGMVSVSGSHAGVGYLEMTGY